MVFPIYLQYVFLALGLCLFLYEHTAGTVPLNVCWAFFVFVYLVLICQKCSLFPLLFSSVYLNPIYVLSPSSDTVPLSLKSLVKHPLPSLLSHPYGIVFLCGENETDHMTLLSVPPLNPFPPVYLVDWPETRNVLGNLFNNQLPEKNFSALFSRWMFWPLDWPALDR